MKKNSALEAAKSAAELKRKELEEAKEAVIRLQSEFVQSVCAVRAAQMAADASLPQCRCVRIGWRGYSEEDSADYVILRKTPTGILVTRLAGDPKSLERRFAMSKYSGTYCEVAKTSIYSHLELRDVPAEWAAVGAQAGVET